MTNKEKIKQILEENNGIVTSSLCEANNIPRKELSRMVNNKTLIRVTRGFYRIPETVCDNKYILQNRYKKIIFSHLDALNFINQTNHIPKWNFVTVPTGYHIPKDGLNAKVYYIRPELLNEGVITITNEFGNKIKCYSFERTIIDLIRYKNSTDIEIFNEACQNYKDYENKDINELKRLSELLRINSDTIEKYLGIKLS